jgi:hypothetical protein
MAAGWIIAAVVMAITIVGLPWRVMVRRKIIMDPPEIARAYGGGRQDRLPPNHFKEANARREGGRSPHLRQSFFDKQVQRSTPLRRPSGEAPGTVMNSRR